MQGVAEGNTALECSHFPMGLEIGGELLIEGLATRGCISHLAQRHRERPVVRGDGGVIFRACALELPLEPFGVENRQ